MSPRVAQGTPRGADSHQKSVQRGHREDPEERKMSKQTKCSTLILDDSTLISIHFHPSGRTGTNKKCNNANRQNLTCQCFFQKIPMYSVILKCSRNCSPSFSQHCDPQLPPTCNHHHFFSFGNVLDQLLMAKWRDYLIY